MQVESQEARLPCYCRYISLPLLSFTLNFIFFIISLVLTINESIQNSSQVYNSCYLGRFITHEVVFFYAITFSVVWLLHILKLRKMKHDQLTQEALKFMIGPMLLALTIIAISFWDKIVHKCKFQWDEYGNVISFQNMRSKTAVFEATVILFSFLISIIMTVLISLQKLKGRDRSQNSLFNSVATYIEAKFESAWQRIQRMDQNDQQLGESLDIMPRHVSLSQVLLTSH